MAETDDKNLIEHALKFGLLVRSSIQQVLVSEKAMLPVMQFNGNLHAIKGLI